MRLPAALVTALFLLLPTACGGSLRGTVVVGPEETPGFPSHSSEGVLILEATYYTNHEEVFGTDLVRLGYIPIAVRIGVRERDGVVRRLSADTLDAKLYLQDGTPLAWVPQEEVQHQAESVLRRVARRSLVLSVLPEWHDAHEGFLFFRYVPDVRIEGTYTLTRDGEYYRELDLLESLVSLSVSTNRGPSRLFAGLRRGHFTDI